MFGVAPAGPNTITGAAIGSLRVGENRTNARGTMKSPEIDLHGFSVSRERLGVSYMWNFPALAAVSVGLSVWNVLAGDGPASGRMPVFLLMMAGLLACLASVLWVIYRLQWKRESGMIPALSIGSDGIHDWRRWTQTIPWSRIKHFRPLTQDPKKYNSFKIEIEGRNDFSKSGLVRHLHNLIVLPMGGDPGFIVSFRELDADAKTVAALVRKIVAAAEA